VAPASLLAQRPRFFGGAFGDQAPSRTQNIEINATLGTGSQKNQTDVRTRCSLLPLFCAD